MSKFPVWWDVTVTVYNKTVDESTKMVTWVSHTLSNCFWKDVGNQVQVGNVTLDTQSIVCRIPANSMFKTTLEWSLLSPEDKAKYFTLNPGDIIICGAVSDVVNEYKAGQRLSDLKAKYKALGCIEIKQVSINTLTGFDTKHYRVVGK